MTLALPLQPHAAPASMAAQPSDDRARLTETARKFEAAFLAEALNHMGLDATKGVEGASAFSSFVNRAYADGLMARGGIGLSESIVRALAQREDAGQGGT